MSAMMRQARAGDDRGQRVGVGDAGHRHAHDVDARLAQLPDLLERGGDVARLRGRHRLDADRRTAPDRDAADLDLSLARHQT